MPSALIHLAIAKELNKKLGLPEKAFFLGAIAPDISKQIGETKQKSHFLYDTKKSIPNIEVFLEKYKNRLKTPFDIGYFVHLYADKLWEEEFIPTIANGNTLTFLNGEMLSLTSDEYLGFLYEDYTNMNVKLIDNYEMDLSLFYEEFEIPHTIIDDIPIEKLNILIDKMGVIIENSKTEKQYVFDEQKIKKFVDETVIVIEKELNEL